MNQYLRREEFNLKRLVALIVIIGIVLMLAGCGPINTLTSLKEKFRGEEEPTITVEIPEESFLQEVPSGDYALEETDEETIVVHLWFGDPQGQTLAVEEREIPKVEGIARATINELLKGPSADSNLLPVIPVGTVLKDINVKDDGLIIVDFSRELIDNHIGGATSEALTVYSIVNTLTQFPTVDRVQFLIDGQYVETLTGHMDLSEAVMSSMEFAP